MIVLVYFLKKQWRAEDFVENLSQNRGWILVAKKEIFVFKKVLKEDIKMT